MGTWWPCSPRWVVAEMEARYQRNIPALTPEEFALLRTKTVAVVGCGGLGGYLIEHLARLGIGTIRAVDGDVFEESNLNRQLLSDVTVLGKSKAQAAKNRMALVNPDVTIEVFEQYLDEHNAPMILASCDAVLGALDNIHTRRILEQTCETFGIPYIYGAIHGWVAQAAIDLPGQRLIEKLYPQGAVLKDKSTLSFTPGLCAAMQTALCVKLLTGRPVETGTVYYMDLLDQEWMTIPLA